MAKVIIRNSHKESVPQFKMAALSIFEGILILGTFPIEM